MKFFVVIVIVGAAACGIGGAALGSLLIGCGGGGKPVVAPNPNGADCLAERQKQQLDCVAKFTTRPEIERCIDEKLKSGAAPECANEAGVAAFVMSRDAGSDK